MAPKKKDAKKSGGPLDPAEERLRHAVHFDTNKFEQKEDVNALNELVKRGDGAISKSEALFLLWYHAFDEDKVDELIQGGVVNTLCAVLELEQSTPVERVCSAGILSTMCKYEGRGELVAKGRGPYNALGGVLHNCLQEADEQLRQHASRALSLLVDDAASRALILKSMDHSLPYAPLYVELLHHCHDHTVVTHVCSLISCLVKGRDDLRDECIAKGLVPALLQALRYHKAEKAAAAAVGCLAALCESSAAWPVVHAAGGIPIMVDLLGPPPSAVMDFELTHYRHLVDPEYLAELQRLRAEEDEARRKQEEEERRLAEAEAAMGSGRLSLHSLTSEASHALGRRSNNGGVKASQSRSNLHHPSSSASSRTGGMSKAAERAVGEEAQPGSPGPSDEEAKAKRAEASQVAAKVKIDVQSLRGDNLPQPPPGTPLLSVNCCGLKWFTNTQGAGMATYSAAASVLYNMATKNEYLHEMSIRLAASRLVPLVAHTIEEGDPGKKKKGGKKKGLTLSAEQTTALIAITGCLKFLSLMNMNRYRIAQRGATPFMTSVYTFSPHTLLRRNAQTVLSNISLLAENGQVLLEGKLPEEFLVPVPMRLTPQEVDELMVEFPGVREANLRVASASTAARQEAATAAAPPPGNATSTASPVKGTNLRAAEPGPIQPGRAGAKAMAAALPLKR